MFEKVGTFRAASLIAAVFILCVGSKANAEDAAWRVSMSSGEAWFSTSGAQPVALVGHASLKPGDTVRTGQNGRVLLERGAESILISANSVVGLPPEKQGGMSTTILQQAGSILLNVEKRNVQHFEVATPYLAAVVKGTQFRVTVGETGSRVEVLGGQVQVTDYKTGQYALVNPDQSARVSLQGPGGLSLTGSGTLNPIQHGTPRRPSVTPIVLSNDSPIQQDKPRATAGPSTAGGSSVPPGLTRGSSATPIKAPNESPETSNQIGQRLDGSAPARLAESAANSPDGKSEHYGQPSGFVAWSKERLGQLDRKNETDSLALMLGLPAGVGISVAIGAAALRRRKKRMPGGR